MSLLTLIIVLLLISAVWGGFGHTQNWGAGRSWSPLGVIAVVLIVLWLSGNLGHHGLRLR